LKAVGLAAVDAEDRSHQRSLIALPRDVQQQLALLVGPDLAEPLVRMDERQPEPRGLVERRLQLHSVEVAEVEGLVGSVVVGRSPALPRSVRDVQVARQRQVILAVLAALDVP